MNRNLWLFIMLFFSVSAFAQKASLREVLIDFGTKAPIAGVKVSLKNKNISVTSSKDGVFIFKKNFLFHVCGRRRIFCPKDGLRRP